MNEQLNKPKRFGEILDATFRLAKSRFKDFFLIVLTLIGPLYLLEAIFLSATGTSFFRETGSGANFLEQAIASFDETATTTTTGDLAEIVVGFPLLVLTPVAQVAILFAVDHLKKQQEFTVGAVIKQAFSRFGPIFASSLLLGLIVFGMVFVSLLFVFILGVVITAAEPVTGVLTIIILLAGIGLVIAYFGSRFSFYLGINAFQNRIPGFKTSWQLTRKSSWRVLGLFIVFFLIFIFIRFGIEAIFIGFLGNSVLNTIILNVVTLGTTTIFSVGYAIIFFDLKIRNDGDDLKELLDNYETTDQ